MKNRGKTMVHAMTTIPLAITIALASGISIADDQALVKQADSSELEWGPCPEFMPASCGIAVLHGDPAEPNADVFFRLAGGTTAPNHRHTSAERMVLVSGQLGSL